MTEQVVVGCASVVLLGYLKHLLVLIVPLLLLVMSCVIGGAGIAALFINDIFVLISGVSPE